MIVDSFLKCSNHLMGFDRLLNRNALIFAAACMLLVMVELIVPPLAYHYSVRDSDMGLWFCGGVVLAELSMFGLVTCWRYGPLQWRVLGGLAFNLLVVEIAVHSVWLCVPMSTEDMLCLMKMLFGASVFFGVTDLLVLRVSRIALVRQRPTEEQVQAEHKAAHSWQFGTVFLLSLIALSSIVALMWRQALSLNVVAYHSYRNYYAQGLPFLLLLVSFFWVLHVSLLWATLQSAVRRGMIASLLIGLLGTELIRRVEQWKNAVTLDYLNWEFSMIVLGFATLHVILGSTFRWLGWELKSC
jgi:hypothetical protein